MEAGGGDRKRRSERLAGLLVPVSALRSEDDLGIGDVRAVRRLIDWLDKMGMSFLHFCRACEHREGVTDERMPPRTAKEIYAIECCISVFIGLQNKMEKRDADPIHSDHALASCKPTRRT